MTDTPRLFIDQDGDVCLEPSGAGDNLVALPARDEDGQIMHPHIWAQMVETFNDCQAALAAERARADALVAELYDALTECLALLESAEHDQFDGVWPESEFEETYAPFRAALAKARGEE